MMRFAAALLLLVLFNSAIYAQTKTPRVAWLNGTWEGTGYQMDDGSTWTIRLKVSQGKYLIEYPSLKCGGQWRPLRLTSWVGEFRERIGFGLEDCVNGGRVIIQRLNGTQVSYRFSYRGTNQISASAILNRK